MHGREISVNYRVEVGLGEGARGICHSVSLSSTSLNINNCRATDELAKDFANLSLANRIRSNLLARLAFD